VRASSTIINHHPVNVPTLQVHAIGSGGGAIAWIDAGGNLQVGPHSAQAVPGPACYGRGGTEPTNTDANLVLGILTERGLLGGKRTLDLNASREAIRTRIAEPLGLSVEDAAAAIYAIQNAQTGDLLRKVVVEAGHDPREFVLYAFGGAGPAHCAGYAAELGVAQVVVPLGQVASAFSAYGLAASDIALAAELSDPSAFPMDPVAVEKNFAQLESQVREGLDRQGVRFARLELFREIDMRYSMQLAELAAPVDDGPVDGAQIAAIAERFERRYAEMYGRGSGFRAAGMQAITYRVRAVGILPFSPALPAIAQADGPAADAARTGSRPIRLGGDRYTDTDIYDYARLRAGHRIPGPAIVEVPTTTVVVPAGATGTVDRLGNLIITREELTR
jgi:N-methylhydantoinase A